MIKVSFLKSNDTIVGFRVEGHSGYAKLGSDIICASVSSVAYMVANTITDIYKIPPTVLSVEDGFMELKLTLNDAVNVKQLLLGFELHLLQLCEQYPKYVFIKHSEV